MDPETQAETVTETETQESTAPEKDSDQPQQQITEQTTTEPRGPDGWVPKVRFNEVIGERNQTREELQREREQRIRLEEQVKASKSGGDGQTREYTRAELKQAVEAGQITEERMEEVLDEQRERRVLQRVEAQSRAREAATKLHDRRNQYSALVPGWDRPGTEPYQKADREYADLLAMGFPADVRTEVLALERAFGKVEALMARTTQRTTTNGHRETTAETSGGNQTPPSQTKKTYVSRLSKVARDDYEEMIRRGHYSGWDAVEAELKFSAEQDLNPRLKNQMAAL